MLDTSGICVTEKDNGTVELFYADYNVEQFGGSDFEATYYLDRENSEKLRSALKKTHSGTLQEMVEAAFTKRFSGRKFSEFCKEHKIDFDVSYWS